MATRTAVLADNITSDARRFSAGVSEVEGKLAKFQNKMNKLTVPAMAVVGRLAVIGKGFVDLAAQAEQNFGGAEAVFGQFADGIKKKGEDAYKSLGLSQSDYLSTANKMGSLFQGSGISQQKSVTMTADAMQRAADVASVMGLDVTAAMESVTGAAKGNFTMMDNLGVAMNATSIEAYAVSKGMTDFSFATASTADKTTLAMDMFMDKTSQYAGTFTNELNTMSGAQDMLKAQFENFGVKIGSALLPVLTDMTQHLSGIVDWVSQNSTTVLILAGVLGGLASAVLVVNGAMKAWAAAQAVATAAQWLFNAAMSANPIGLVVIAIGLLIAVIVLAYNNIGWFRDGVDAALKWIGEAWANTTQWISDVWNGFIGFLNTATQAGIDLVRGHFEFMATLISVAFAAGQLAADNFVAFFVNGFGMVQDSIMHVINWVDRLFSGFTIPGWLSDVMGFMGVGATGFSINGGFDMSGLEAGLGATGSILSIGGSGGSRASAPDITQVTNNITVNGALDPNAVARQIGTLLDQRDRQRGVRPAAGGFR